MQSILSFSWCLDKKPSECMTASVLVLRKKMRGPRMEPCETPVVKLSTRPCPCHLVGATHQLDSLQGGKEDLKFTVSNAGDEVYEDTGHGQWSTSISVGFRTFKRDCWESRRFFCERVG